jgi:SP family sugar:H+ symporter-like MFS transporter
MHFSRKEGVKEAKQKDTPDSTTPVQTPLRENSLPSPVDLQPQGKIPAVAVVLGAVASIGGFIFGYESGQISGFLAMSDFTDRFGDNGSFSAVRQGTIVGLLAWVSLVL